MPHDNFYVGVSMMFFVLMFVIVIASPPTIGYAAMSPECRDGLDNDGDGRVDGFDQGCLLTKFTESADRTECKDGFDNDYDGLVDRDDPGCWAYRTIQSYDERWDAEIVR